MVNYYADKIDSLRDLFQADEVCLESRSLVVNGETYPILDDVIILLEPDHYPQSVKIRLAHKTLQQDSAHEAEDFSLDIQFTFGEEWQRFPEIHQEYDKVFNEYFDLVDMASVENKRICDLGCGTGRWSYLLTQKSKPREFVMVDFSEAIFVARKNLNSVDNVLFFMADIQCLPFRPDFADLIFSLGVLHHLPSNALDVVRNLKTFAPRLLIYLYYSLDNRPFHFRLILSIVTLIRTIVCKVHSRVFRDIFSWAIAAFVYAPVIWIGRLLDPIGLSRYIPLYAEQHYKSFRWWRLLAYDRFFTRIEQRVSRKEIMTLEDTFRKVKISPHSSYWHFLCER